MKNLEQIKNDVEALFKGDSEYYDIPEIKVRQGDYGDQDQDAVYVTISQMYEKPKFAEGMLQLLQAMAKTMGTKDVDIYDETAYPGCESCDYGSSYGWEFVGWN